MLVTENQQKKTKFRTRMICLISPCFFVWSEASLDLGKYFNWMNLGSCAFSEELIQGGLIQQLPVVLLTCDVCHQSLKDGPHLWSPERSFHTKPVGKLRGKGEGPSVPDRALGTGCFCPLRPWTGATTRQQVWASSRSSWALASQRCCQFGSKIILVFFVCLFFPCEVGWCWIRRAGVAELKGGPTWAAPSLAQETHRSPSSPANTRLLLKRSRWGLVSRSGPGGELTT